MKGGESSGEGQEDRGVDFDRRVRNPNGSYSVGRARMLAGSARQPTARLQAWFLLAEVRTVARNCRFPFHVGNPDRG